MFALDRPEHDEVEVSIFGPGFGEAIALHLGSDEWILIDSCWLDRVHQVPVTGKYLDEIGVPTSQVKQIVASHWHDDHVGGLSVLIQKYSDAEFSYPSYLSKDEGRQFVAAYAGTVEKSTRGTRELYRSLKHLAANNRKRYPLHVRSLVHEGSYAYGKVQAFALSPTTEAWEKSMAAMHSKLSPGTIPRNVAEPKTNISSIVIHIDLGLDGILLGSDLESDGTLGWHAVSNDPWASSRTKSSLYKVAHHGSQTACLPEVWSKFLRPGPAVGLTPFVNGSVRLPLPTDVARIKGYGGTLHATSLPGKSLPKSSEAEKLLTTFLSNATGRSKRMGHIRYRKRPGERQWRCDVNGAALKL